MLGKILKHKKNVKGATAIEYALIASLIAVVAITGMKTIGSRINQKLHIISQNIEEAGTT